MAACMGGAPDDFESRLNVNALSPKAGVVVANPGSIPEMARLADALSRAGLLRTYVTPVGFTSQKAQAGIAKRLPLPLRRRVLEELRRRELGPSIRDDDVAHAATLLELASVLAGRSVLLRRVGPALQRARNAALDAEVASRVGPNDVGVVTAYTAAARTLRRSRSLGVRSFLEYPIGHHRYAMALLEEEASRVPQFASTLPHAPWPQELVKQLDEEIRLADRIFVLSSFHLRTFAESGVDEGKLILTPLGVDTQMFSPSPRVDDGVFRIAFVGQVTQRKGISYLLRAFDLADIPRSELIIAGPIVGSDRPWRNHQRLRYIPAVPRWRLRDIYATADVFVLPSLLEGFPLTALEAMACGLPVVVSENTFGRDVIRDGVEGFVVPIRASEAIADRLRYLAALEGIRTRMGAAARARAEMFSWSRYERLTTEAIAAP